MLDNETLFSLLAKGGIMQIFIGISSVIALAIIIERYLTYSQINKRIKSFSRKLSTTETDGGLAEIKKLAENSNAITASLIALGIKNMELSEKRMAETIEVAGKKILFDLERGLSTLATISGVAPLLGFLGTVTGMISAFMQIQNLEGVANPSDLAGGIWEALITTASGLAVGIIALTAYNYFAAQVKKISLEMESAANFVINKASEPKRK